MKLPKKFFLVTQGKLNQILAEAFPEAVSQKGLTAIKNGKKVIINFAWEISANEITQLKKSVRDSGMSFDVEVWVQCGDNSIRPAKQEEWDKSYKKRQTKKKKIAKVISGFIHKIPD